MDKVDVYLTYVSIINILTLIIIFLRGKKEFEKVKKINYKKYLINIIAMFFSYLMPPISILLLLINYIEWDMEKYNKKFA